MKTIRIFGTRGLILAAALGVSVGVGFVSPALAQTAVIVDPDGKLTHLGTLGGLYSFAFGINDAGQVAGKSHTATAYYPHAFIAGSNGTGMRDLGTLGGNKDSSAAGINNAGQVGGGSYTEDGYRHAFITGPNGMGMRDLGTLSGDPNPWGGKAIGSGAAGINDAGRVVGSSYNEDGYHHAFITGPNGMGMRDLGVLGGLYSSAYGINDAGQVVGISETSFSLESIYHAFITGPDGMGMRDLGTLGGRGSTAYGINNSGQVVGESTTADGSSHAFITGPDGMGMTDLNSIADLSGIYLSNARGINDHGQVIADASVGYIPEPASYAMLLAGLALVGFTARRRSRSMVIGY